MGVNTSESPTMLHVPATAGLSVGSGEVGEGGAERVTVSESVPLAIAWRGSVCSAVAGNGAAEALAARDPIRSPTLWLRATTTTTVPIASTASSAPNGTKLLDDRRVAGASPSRPKRCLVIRFTDDRRSPSMIHA